MDRPDRCPIAYEANSEVIHSRVADVLPPVLEKMKWRQGELILDHGCGSGSTGFKYFVPVAEKTNSTIYAFDICQSSVNYAAKNFAHSNIKYVSGNLQAKPSPLAGLKFDKIFSLYTLQFIKNYRGELRALQELLIPGGEMFMVIMVDTLCFDLYAKLKKDVKWSKLAAAHLVVPLWRNPIYGYEKLFRDAFADAGFEVQEFSLEEKTHVYPLRQAYSDMIFELNGSQNQLSPEDHDELREVYRKFFAETETKYYKPTNSVESTYTSYDDRIVVLLKKSRTCT